MDAQESLELGMARSLTAAITTFRQKVFNGSPPSQEGVPPTAAAAATIPHTDERELLSLREQLQASLAENERLRAELAELRPTADPDDAFVAATNAMGLNDADRQLVEEKFGVKSVDDLVLSSDDYHAIGIHIEAKQHAMELRNALGEVKLSDELIDLVLVKAQSGKCASELLFEEGHVTEVWRAQCWGCGRCA
jgi:hypothetical protein